MCGLLPGIRVYITFRNRVDLLNATALDRFARRHRDAQAWLAHWRAAVESAHWKSLADVRLAYAAADGVRLKGQVVVTVFNVKGNEYRLLTSIHYTRQTVLVLEVLTHAEYSRGAWKAKY
jgi:mRNA interferase HigB